MEDDANQSGLAAFHDREADEVSEASNEAAQDSRAARPVDAEDEDEADEDGNLQGIRYLERRHPRNVTRLDHRESTYSRDRFGGAKRVVGRHVVRQTQCSSYWSRYPDLVDDEEDEHEDNDALFGDDEDNGPVIQQHGSSAYADGSTLNRLRRQEDLQPPMDVSVDDVPSDGEYTWHLLSKCCASADVSP